MISSINKFKKACGKNKNMTIEIYSIYYIIKMKSLNANGVKRCGKGRNAR